MRRAFLKSDPAQVKKMKMDDLSGLEKLEKV